VRFEEYAAARVRGWVSLVTAMCGDGGLAEDVVQEVLIRVHARWDLIGPMAGRGGYVRRMLVNELTSWRRKWSRIAPVGDVPERGARPDHAGAVADRDDLMRQLLGLPLRRRMVLAMRYLADMPDEQIAQAMGCRAFTVRAYASRALAALRVQLDADTAADTTERSGR
jgi:RNA polymerase sigma-70 factor (sigma-E family)